MKRNPYIIILFTFALLVGSFFALIAGVYQMATGGSLIREPHVAILEIVGPIFDSEETLKKIEEVTKNELIKGIVLRIDSPGGAVAPSQEIFKEFKKLRTKMPVVVSMGTVAASGGYYIAQAGLPIYANGGSITGSIGVIMEGVNLSRVLNWAMVDQQVLKSGQFKDAGSPFREMTPDEKDYLQSILDDMYRQFIRDVAESRGLTVEVVQELAQGKIYTGEQAFEHKLVDKLGSLTDAIAEAKTLANLPPESPVEWPETKEGSLKDLLSSQVQKQVIDLVNYLGRVIGESNLNKIH